MELTLYEISCELSLFASLVYFIWLAATVVLIKFYRKRKIRFLRVIIFMQCFVVIAWPIKAYFLLKECYRKQEFYMIGAANEVVGFPEEIDNTGVYKIGNARFNRRLPNIHNGGSGCWDGAFVSLPIKKGDVLKVIFFNPTREERYKCILSIVKLKQQK